jgi:ribosomal protein L39E
MKNPKDMMVPRSIIDLVDVNIAKVFSKEDGAETNMERKVITPDIARTLLRETNNSNRSISRPTVAKYAHDMRNGNWLDTHQNVIAFYEDGELADGQHRLSAVIEANRPIPMWVVYNLTKEGGRVIDQGRKRSTLDAMKIADLLEGLSNPTYSIPMAKLIMSMEKNVINLSTTFTVDQVKMGLDKMKDGINFSCKNLSAINGHGLKNASVRSAVAVAYYNVDNEKLKRFCRVLVSGIPEGDGDEMIIRLRNWLAFSNPYRTENDRRNTYRTVCKFIKMYDSGQNPNRVFRATDDVFKTNILAEVGA